MKSAMQYTILILALLWGLVSCAPKAIVVSQIAPKATVVHERVARAKASGEVLRKTVSETRQQAKGIAAEADSLKSEANRLSLKPSLTPEDWSVFKTLAETHSRNTWAHEIISAQGDEQAKTLQADQEAAEKESAELVDHATKTDVQTTAITVKNASLTEDAGKWKALRTIFIAGGLLLFVLFAVFAFFRLS